MRVVVAGGGLAGLVAARRLAEAGVDVQLFERDAEVGGRARTTREDGFTFDRGFQVLFTSYPAARRELDLEALDLRTFAPGVTIARPGHRSTLSDPRRDPRNAVETVLNPDVSIADKLRVLRLRRELAGKDGSDIVDGEDTSIREYLAARGFSRGFVENVAEPFYGGVTLDRSLETSSVVFEYTVKMLAEGRAAVPAAGMAALPRQLAARAREAGATIETGRTVRAVFTAGEEVTVEVGGESVAADAAVVATDPATAGDLTGATTPREGRGCVTQYFALPGYKDLDTGRRIVLNAADARPNQVAPLSAVAPEYAPDDRRLVSATFPGVPDDSDGELAADVREALESWYPGQHFEGLELLRTERVPFAQFEQRPGFRARLPGVDAPGRPVYLAGDYTRWSSIQGALESGRRAAEAVL